MVNKISSKLIRVVICFILLAPAMSCSTQSVDIKSPCVSTDEGPCGPKRSINNWWLKNNV